MFYSELLCKQIDECSNRIVSLKNKAKYNKNPELNNMIISEIKNTEFHICSLKKLKFMFENTAYSN
ncbi:MAG: hypothetical protein AB1782_10975 [Cyanobacteriota bacterium]